MRYGYPARQADAFSWNSRAQGCFKGAGYPYRTPTLSQRSYVPCASTTHTGQLVDSNGLLRKCRETVLLFAALCQMGRKSRSDPKRDFARPANRWILHHRGQAGNATAVTVSTRFAGPALSLRSWRMTRRRRRRGRSSWPDGYIWPCLDRRPEGIRRGCRW